MLLTAVASVFFGAGYSAHSASASGWAVVFADNFDGTSLDLTKWYTRFIDDNGTLDHYKNELERYRDGDHHVVQDGILSLVANTPDAGSGGYYPSGMIRSSYTFRYGYLEARIKMPPGRGLWPAFWLLSGYDANHRLGWPPEIDVMEYAPNLVTEFPDMVHSNVGVGSTGVQGGKWYWRDAAFNPTYHFYKAGVDLTEDWHVYGMLWQPNTVTVYLDGKRLWYRTYHWIYNDKAQAGPAYILINLAVGGGWAGAGGIDNSAFPAKLQVDYVRVCQRSDAANAPARCAGSRYAPE